MATEFLNLSTDTTLGGINPSDVLIPSQKAIKTAIAGKQDTLVSGTNIKTINNSSILGQGDIDVGTVKSVNNTNPDTNGNVQIAIPTVNDATLTITQGGTTKGTFTANASSNVTIDLDAGGGSNVDQTYDPTSANAQSGVAINGAGFLNNTATGSNSLTLLGTATTTTGSTNIGFGSQCSAGNYATALGHNANGRGSSAVAIGRAATASGSFAMALGYGATCSGGKSIQLGYGTNSTAISLFVGFQGVDNYQLLDGSTGLIPYQRLPIDSKSITTNANALQAIGIIDQNNPANALKVWHGTQAEYDALATHDANTRYYTDGGLSVSLLSVIYPVGSIYITTNSSCPLSTLIAGSTWVLVGQDRVLQGAGTRGVVGTTLNESLPNIKGGIASNGNYAGLRSGTPYGAFTQTSGTGGLAGEKYANARGFDFDASRSSSAYQDNAPVQPDAYLVNIYRRIS